MKISVSIVRKKTSEKVTLFENSIEANTFWARLKGLLGRKELGESESLVITPCSQVHTIGMKFSIDVIFVDKDKKVIRLTENLPPYSHSKCKNAYSVIEVTTGMIERYAIKVGDQFSW